MSELPGSFTVNLDESVEVSSDGATLLGGHPRRRICLTADGLRAFESLREGDLETPAARRLARRLVATGMAHPVPHDSCAPAPTTVVIPTRDRPQMLARCLGGIPPEMNVVVVDDGSVNPRAIERVCAARDAELIRLPQNAGPAAARNAGLDRVDTEVVAFVDSDCLIPSGSLERLSCHFSDPQVAAVAPRVVPFAAHPHRLIASISDAYRDLDMGPRSGLVGPSKPIPWVPSAVLLARRAALARAFDPSLRCGEDVDLVWRLHDDGWDVRFDASVVVLHHEPENYRALLRRRHRYGASVGPLARRHPGRLPQVHLGGVTAISRTTVKFAAPLLVAAAAHKRTRLMGVALLAAPVLAAYRRDGPGSGVRRALVALHQLADDFAYGSGVLRGCRTAHTWSPLAPRGRA